MENLTTTFVNELKKFNVTLLNVEKNEKFYLLTCKQKSGKVITLPAGMKQGLTVSQNNDSITFFVSVSMETAKRMERNNQSKQKRNTKVLTVKNLIYRLQKEEISGFTIDYYLNTPKDGFLVGGYSKVYENPTNAEIEQLIVDAFYARLYVGGWKDKKTSKIYIELAKRFSDESKAIETAKKLNQIAVCNIATHVGIRLK